MSFSNDSIYAELLGRKNTKFKKISLKGQTSSLLKLQVILKSDILLI